MPESDFLRILLSHDCWATAQLLDACRGLSVEQFHRRLDIGPGSLHAGLTHIVGVMRTWTQTLAEQDLGPRLDTDGQSRTPEQLRVLLDEAARVLAAEAHRRPLDEMVSRRMRDGTISHLTRGQVLAHVATHGMHHRAQCLNMLRQLGVNTFPPSSVYEWARTGDA